jgi:hypothetical protein
MPDLYISQILLQLYRNVLVWERICELDHRSRLSAVVCPATRGWTPVAALQSVFELHHVQIHDVTFFEFFEMSNKCQKCLTKVRCWSALRHLVNSTLAMSCEARVPSFNTTIFEYTLNYSSNASLSARERRYSEHPSPSLWPCDMIG